MNDPRFDPEEIMREVRAKANLSFGAAATATSLPTDRGRSNVATVAEDGVLNIVRSNVASVAQSPEQIASGEELRDAIEERAGLCADRIPAPYRFAWAQLNHQKPTRVSDAAWRLALGDGGRFLDQWGTQAAELGWRPNELFAARAGLIWRLCGGLVEAIDADSALLASGLVVLRQETRGFR
jgi:hypothetical protein